MNFGMITSLPCINAPAPADNRCEDAAFALAHPDMCPQTGRLLLKPGLGLSCVLAGVQFRAYLLEGGTEKEITSGVIYSSSNPDVATIGSASGKASGLSAGTTTITATYGDLEAYSEFVVLAGDDCCAQNTVAMLVLVDTSRSMGQQFGYGYTTRMAFAKAAATRFISEVNASKDTVGLITFNGTDATVLSGLTSDVPAVTAMVPGIIQTQEGTSFYDAMLLAVDSLNAATVDRRVLIIISDGEDGTATYTTANDPVALASNFKQVGGIVISVGARAAGKGYGLLSALATSGFFLNAHGGNGTTTLNYLSGLKGYICAGNCTPEGDEIVPSGALNYCDFTNWVVMGNELTDLAGHVDLVGNGLMDLLPNNGLYVDLAGSTTPYAGRLESKELISLTSGHDYRMTVRLAGNQRVDRKEEVTVAVYSRNNDGLDAPVIQSAIVSESGVAITPETYTYYVTAVGVNGETLPSAGVIAVVNTEDATVSIGWATITGAISYRVYRKSSHDDRPYLLRVVDASESVAIPSEILESKIPIMTSDTTPSGVVTASGQEALYQKWKAFDGNNGTHWTSASGWPQWIQYQFVSPETIEQYRIVWDGNHPFISSWTFSGSNNGSAWDELDAKVNYLGSPPPVGHITTGVFDISNTTAYSYYRLTITAIVWPGFPWAFGSVTELQLWGSVEGAETQFSLSDTYRKSDVDDKVESGEIDACNKLPTLDKSGSINDLLRRVIVLSSFDQDFQNYAFTFAAPSALDVWLSVFKSYGVGDPVDAVGPLLDRVTLEDTTILSTEFTDDFDIENPQYVPPRDGAGSVFHNLGYGYYGYAIGYSSGGTGCLSEPPGAQSPEPNPLPDIESGYTPPPAVDYTSTKQACASCSDGYLNLSTVNLIPVMTSNTEPAGEAISSGDTNPYEAFRAFDDSDATEHLIALSGDPVPVPPFYIGYMFDTATIVNRYSFKGNYGSWSFQGSHDGINWTTLDTHADLFSASLTVANHYRFTNTTAYTYYRMLYSAMSSLSSVADPTMVELAFYYDANTQACASATATSQSSQSTADLNAQDAALVAATAKLNCVRQYTETVEYTFKCPGGSPSATRSATKSSLVSSNEAKQEAEAAAKALAVAAAACP